METEEQMESDTAFMLFVNFTNKINNSSLITNIFPIPDTMPGLL